MRKLLLLFIALLTGVSGAWAADITVNPSNGVYWKNGAETTDAWAPIWKSTATASNLTTPLLVLTGTTGMNTANGDIYADTYTLEAPSGYTIVSYSFNGTATEGDVTITPNGGSGTLISNGTSLGSPLSVTVGAQSTTFALSGSGHISSLALTVKVEHYIVTYSISTGSFTTTGNWVNTWNSTATDPQVTFAVSGGANNIASSTGYIYSGASGCTYTLTAQGGYIITGYEIVGRAQIAAQTLTPAAGGSATPFATSGTTTLTVTGLSTPSTTFQQSTPNNGIAISSFKIYLEKDPCTAIYVISDASGVIYRSDPFAATVGNTITTLPSSLQRPYCTYSVTSTEIVSGENEVPVTLTDYAPPFTVSSDFASATWYYATLRNKQLRADESHKDGDGRYQTNSSNERTDVYKWAFVGNPYELSIINKGAGSSKVLYAGNVPVMQAATPASDNKARWVVSSNSTGGFTVRSESGANLYINDAGNGGNLGYWNSSLGANDAGSNWVVSEVTASDKALLGDALTTANSLYTTLNPGAGKLGYPTAAALSTFNTAISTAQGVYDDESGDYYSAYTTLNAAIATLKAAIVYTPRTDVYYTIVNSRGAMVYDPSHDESVDATNDNAKYLWYGSSTPDPTDVNNLWGFIEQGGNYYMYNVGKQQFASVGTGTYGSTWIFSDTPAYITLDDGIADEIAAPNVRIRATIATTSATHTMSVSTKYTGPIITYDGNGDGGVPMLFTESATTVDDDVTDIMVSKVTDLTPYKNALNEVLDECALITIGTGLNEYASNSTYTTALSAAETIYADNNATQSELQTATANLQSAMDGLSINLPATGKFYRIKGYSDNYITSNTANSNASMNGSTSANNIVYYSAEGNLIFFGSGYGMYYTSYVAPAGSDLDSYTFLQGALWSKYYVRSNASGVGTYCYDNTSNGIKVDRNTSPVTSGSYQTDWTLEEVTTLPVTISDAGYATLYSPVALTIPEGVKVYYVSSLTETEATLTEISDIIPANTPVILKNTGSFNFDIANEAGTDVSEYNKLSGSIGGGVVVIADEAYTLQRNEANTQTGFFKKAAGTIAGFKAYLLAEKITGSLVKGFTFKFEDGTATGISTIENGQVIVNSDAIFNLAGQRMGKLQRGINIVNGKKLIVK